MASRQQGSAMSKQEKASWSLLVTNLVVGAWYLSALLALGTDLAGQLEAMMGLFIRLTIVSVVLAILGEIVMHALAEKDQNKVELDERDRLISLKARRNGYFVLVSAVVLVMSMLTFIGFTKGVESSLPDSVTTLVQQAGHAFFMANLLVLALMLTEVAIQGSRVFYYRRG
jgi:hypothetical protein